jgi:hypothetical protein
MSPVRQDYLLRMIEQAFDVIRRLRARRLDGDPAAGVRDADGAVTSSWAPPPPWHGGWTHPPPRSSSTIPSRWRSGRASWPTRRRRCARPATSPAPASWAAARWRRRSRAWLLEDEQRRLTPALRELLAEALAMARGWAEPGELSERHRAVLERAPPPPGPPPAGAQGG